MLEMDREREREREEEEKEITLFKDNIHWPLCGSLISCHDVRHKQTNKCGISSFVPECKLHKCAMRKASVN